MMKQSIFYGLDADQVSKNEALRYFDIENMVHYLYEAGKEPLNNYVYCAMLLVKIVFSQEEGKWGEAFREWIRRMQSGTKTIMRIGVNSWPDIFRAFYFASPQWAREERIENYLKLLRLYQIKYEEKTAMEDRFFSQHVIEDLTAMWEGIPDIKTYVFALGFVTSLEIKNNWNEYTLFYQFLGRSLYVSYRLGYIVRTDYWKIQELTERRDDLPGMHDVSMELLEEIGSETEHCLQVLKSNPRIRPMDLGYYQVISNYLTYIDNVMSCKNTGVEKDNYGIRTTVHDSTAENSQKLEKIEDDREFEEAINRNEDNLSVGNLLYLVERRKENNIRRTQE